MCEKCNSEFEEELDEEDFPDIPFSPTDPILLTTENLDDVEYNKEAFQAGVAEVSFTCGQLTALINVGLSPEDALNYIMNQEIIESNFEMAMINKDTAVAVAKEQSIVVDKNSI